MPKGAESALYSNSALGFKRLFALSQCAWIITRQQQYRYFVSNKGGKTDLNHYGEKYIACFYFINVLKIRRYFYMCYSVDTIP